MKVIKIILAGVFVAKAAAQLPDGFPQCGSTCMKNMLEEAPKLKCPQVGDKPNVTCLCQSVDFGNGLRDCSFQHCQNDTAAGIVMQFSANWCTSNGVAPVNLNPSANTGTAGVSVTTITSGGSSIVSTISTATPAQSNGATDSGSSTGTPTTSGTGSLTSATDAASSSVSAASSSAASSAGATSTNGMGPRQTAAPAGLLAVAGVAVLFL